MLPTCKVITGNALDELRSLESESVQCCVTSPPYYGLRDYGDPLQVGLESTPEFYVERLVAISREIKRVLNSNGTFWLNIGDSYAGSGRGPTGSTGIGTQERRQGFHSPKVKITPGLKPKDRMMIPARVAIALQEDGWFLRDEIVWYKPNPMPESVKDRCTKAHEMIYMLTKSRDYYFNQEAIKEPYSPATVTAGRSYRGQATKDYELGMAQNPGEAKRRIEESIFNGTGANKRSVWEVNNCPSPDEHFAAYPSALITPCILAGSKSGDTILDPFAGTGTTGKVAIQLGRNAILIELNPKYASICESNVSTTPGFAF